MANPHEKSTKSLEALRVRIYPYIHGWQWPYGTISYERDARCGRVLLDRYSYGKAKRLYGCVGKR